MTKFILTIFLLITSIQSFGYTISIETRGDYSYLIYNNELIVWAPTEPGDFPPWGLVQTSQNLENPNYYNLIGPSAPEFFLHKEDVQHINSREDLRQILLNHLQMKFEDERYSIAPELNSVVPISILEKFLNNISIETRGDYSYLIYKNKLIVWAPTESEEYPPWGLVQTSQNLENPNYYNLIGPSAPELFLHKEEVLHINSREGLRQILLNHSQMKFEDERYSVEPELESVVPISVLEKFLNN